VKEDVANIMVGQRSTWLQVVGPTDNWILERLARRLAALLPYAEFAPWLPHGGAGALMAYYVNYALYEEPSGLIDVGFFTHRDDGQGFLERARHKSSLHGRSGELWIINFPKSIRRFKFLSF
jgi:hypothetical protein